MCWSCVRLGTSDCLALATHAQRRAPPAHAAKQQQDEAGTGMCPDMRHAPPPSPRPNVPAASCSARSNDSCRQPPARPHTHLLHSTPPCRILLSKKIHRLPVVDENGTLVGVLSRGNIIKAALAARKAAPVAN
jgi:hypothetical protein